MSSDLERQGGAPDGRTPRPPAYLEEPAFLGRPFPRAEDPIAGPPRSLGMLLGVALFCLTGAVLMWRVESHVGAIVLAVLGTFFGGGYVLLIRHYIQEEVERTRRASGFYDLEQRAKRDHTTHS